jgi:phytoene synthase
LNSPEELGRAYAECRAIAKQEAKNFYYAFLALPREKRDAMCAVYAFMRRADDISDDESLPRNERQRMMLSWVDEWHAAAGGAATHDAVFIAVRDTKQKFQIPSVLFDQLVEGTAMDLEAPVERSQGAFDTYATFDELYRYCYLVASVVGLVCIRIFGYSDATAEKLAEQTGIAFQLTNILRDVREDAERGRIYLPLEGLARHGVTPERLASRRDAQVTESERELLREMSDRAREYYKSADKLVPLIDADSRPALRVLVSIYRRLLDHIEAQDFNVFSQRISVPKREKWAILFRGLRQAMAARVKEKAR